MRKVLADLFIVTGLASLGVGLWMVAPWIALAVVGVLLILFGLLMARAAS